MKEKFNRESIIKIRGGYSDRNGFNPVSNTLQVDDLDDRTRTILSNAVFEVIDDVFDFSEKYGYDKDRYYDGQIFLKKVLSEVFGEINYLEDVIHWKDVIKKINYVICHAVINEVLDIIEYVCCWIENFCEAKQEEKQKYSFYYEEQEEYASSFVQMNEIFEKECVGYRFVNREIIRNIDKTEITTIEEASDTKFDGCNTHIKKATHYLYDREKPDYKNSIKESISAVESICRVIAGDGATLGDALKVLEKKRGLKGQLKSGFEKLYNYTNDKGGIRHAEGLFVSEVTFEEAKYMLVSCSAFVNYLIAEYGKIGD